MDTATGVITLLIAIIVMIIGLATFLFSVFSSWNRKQTEGMSDIRNDMSDIRNDMSDIRNDMSGIRNDMSGIRNELTNLRIEFKDDINQLESRLSAEINRVETRLGAEIAEARLDTKALEARVFYLATDQKQPPLETNDLHEAQGPIRRNRTPVTLP